MTMDEMLQWLLPHWPFFAAAILFGYIGVNLKKVVTTDMAEQSRAAWWFRATLPLHPVLGGIALGSLNMLPTSLGATGNLGGALYYGVAGAVSSWVYGAFKHFVEKRTLKGAPASLAKPKS